MKKIFLAVLFFLFLTEMSNAVVITFDDHPDATQNAYGPIGTYNGFEFHATNSLDRLDWIDTVGSAWDYGAISGDFTMLDNFGGEGRINAVGNADFTFDGLYARIWRTGTNALIISGYQNGSLAVSAEYTLTTDWTYYSGWDGVLINALHLVVPNGIFLVDNLALNESQVPIPSTLTLLAFGLVGLAGVAGGKALRPG
ncbi:MAG: hypothetical protein HUN04_21980 [Desulfobacter sp.]|nr:MAG: hypothetical protein HUN04_21980 [Desulfobacter sp.]